MSNDQLDLVQNMCVGTYVLELSKNKKSYK